MMLDISQALNDYKKVYPAGSQVRIYIFKCIECDNQMHVERKYIKKHSGKCKNCSSRKLPYMGSYNHMKDGVIRTNKKRNRNLSFELTYEDFLDFTKIKNCYYCNKQLIWNAHTGLGRYKSNLDRKDSNMGYSKQNCVACCSECNYMKNKYFSSEEFLIIRNFLTLYRQNKDIADIIKGQFKLFFPSTAEAMEW